MLNFFRLSLIALLNRCCLSLCACVIGFNSHAQHIGADSAITTYSTTTYSSTVAKLRPLSAVSNLIDLAVEQTLSKRSSVVLEGTHSVLLFRNLRAMGQTQGVAVSLRYYPLTHEAAPAGWYVGPRFGYDRVSASSLLKVLTLFDAAGKTSMWSMRGVVGYQLCTRGNIVLDAQGSVGLLYRLTYYRSGLYTGGQPTVERRTGFGPLRPAILIGVGYRFKQHRNRRNNN